MKITVHNSLYDKFHITESCPTIKGMKTKGIRPYLTIENLDIYSENPMGDLEEEKGVELCSRCSEEVDKRVVKIRDSTPSKTLAVLSFQRT